MKLHFPCFGSNVFAMSFVYLKRKYFRICVFVLCVWIAVAGSQMGFENLYYFQNIFSRQNAYIILYINVNVSADVRNMISNVVISSTLQSSSFRLNHSLLS